MSIAELVPSWRALPEPTGPNLLMSSVCGLSYRTRVEEAFRPDAIGVMAVRGIAGDAEIFLTPHLRRDMPSPFILADMDRAAARLALAVVRREKIVVFGDYDVDGASASAVIGRWFAHFDIAVTIYIPDRISEGYGPGDASMAAVAALDPDLVICVDCGTSSGSFLSALVADVVVIDHHKPQGDLPLVVAVVNPHREDCTSELGMLCAASLAFLTVTGAQSKLRDSGMAPADLPRLLDLLDIVALATVADVVPLVGPSRLFVAKGLEVISRSPSIGIAALMEVAGVTDVTAGRLGFALGPRVNAGGRVGTGTSSGSSGAIGVRLLMSTDVDEARGLAQQLDAMNRERQEVEKACLEEAMAMAEGQVLDGQPIVSVFGTDWHPGVVGIVAGRVREKFNVPALIGTLIDGSIRGSGRSVGGFDLGAVIIEASRRGLLVGGGGHAMACGFSCSGSEWATFEKFVRGRAQWTTAPLVLDGLVEAALLSTQGVSSFVQLEPLGQGMPSVKILIGGLTLGSVKDLKTAHLKLNLKHGSGSFDGLWWRAIDEGRREAVEALVGREVCVVGTPKVDSWNGRERITIEVTDIMEGCLP